MDLVEVAPNRWRVAKPYGVTPPARSALPCPHVISDAMPATEQVDGHFYESKSAFRAVGRALGLTEVGTEKPRPRTSSVSDLPEIRRARRDAIAKAVAQHRAGRRPIIQEAPQ